MSPREYLLTRFHADADALRIRATTVQKGPPQPGPDAAMSTRMAEACDDVVATLSAIPPASDAQAEIAALLAVIPLLEQRASAAAKHPPVRAVYAGAATRIREVKQAEDRRLSGGEDVDSGAADDDDNDHDNEAFDE